MKSNNNLSSLKRKSLNLGKIYISLIFIFLLTMIFSYAIPNKRINWHVSESAQQLKVEGVYPRPFFNTLATQLDNFTDSWMLNLAISADNKHPLKSSLQSPHRVMDNYDTGKINKVENLEQSTQSDDYHIQSYSRYWHGYLGILRPLLLFFNYSEIRFINMCVLFLLFIVVNLLIQKKIGTKIMISFFLSMMMVMFIIVPMSLQFSSMFYVMFISMIVMLVYHETIEKDKLAIYGFFIIGCITSFLDLLTVPLITLGIPLITYILLIQKSGRKSWVSNTIEIIKNSFIWAIGYGLTWASKWVIASIVLKENIIKDALNQILSRTSGSDSQIIYNAKDVIESNTEIIFTSFIMKILIIIFILWILAMIFYKKNTEEIIKIVPILLISLMPFVWYFVLKNHSQVHYWFTYRNLCITVYSIFAFMSYNIDFKNKKIIKIKK